MADGDDGKESDAAKKVENGDALAVAMERAPVVFRPFPAIGDEMYPTYQPPKAEG